LLGVVNIESLLKPLSPEAPCGENLRWDRRFLEVERLPEGKEETQFSAAIEPDWREVRDGCVELLARGKHLRVAVLLMVAAIRQEGYPGLRDGLKLIQGLLEQYWDSVYPQLDAEDNNDPTERINALAPLATPLATFGDKLKLLDKVQESPLCESRQLGKFSLKDIALAAGTLEPLPTDADKPLPNLETIDAAFIETDAEKLEEIGKAAEEAAEALKAIEAIFTEKCGAGIGPDLGPFGVLLKDAATQVRRRQPGGAAEGGGSEAAGGGGQSGGGGGGGGQLTGEVTSPAEVLMALEKVSRYYQVHEPSSPVPLIVKCAQRMVTKSFLDIVKVLTPDAVSTLERIGEPPAEV